jgi:MFS family permease
VIAGVCTLSMIVAGSIVAFPEMPRAAFLTLAASFSGFALTLYSLSVSHVNDKLEPAQMVASSSTLLLLNGGAAALGPLLAGSLITVFGPRAYFATLAALSGALAVYDLWRQARGRPVPPSQKSPFIRAQPRG